MNTMKWLLKREFWENKGGFFWAPVIAGALFIALNVMMGLVGIVTADRSKIEIGALKIDQALQYSDPTVMAQVGASLDLFMVLITALVMLITAVVVFFYSISALYDERRDRSILFWKSLPLSDSQTVLSKVLAAALIAPAIGLVAGIVTALLMSLVAGMFGLYFSQNLFGVMFSASHPFKVAFVLAASLPVAAVWALPTIGWLMLCSVWARSKPFLWAVALPVAAGIMVSWFDMLRSFAIPDSWFWKHVVARMLISVLPGSWLSLGETSRISIHSAEEASALISLGEVYSTFGRLDIWVGAAAGVAMLVLAIRMRRWRDDG
jgi:ABC-2 type transport system permease protein